MEEAVKTLTLTVPCNQIIPISTSGIGILTQHYVVEYERSVRAVPPGYSRYAFYRVALGQLSCRLNAQYLQRSGILGNTSAFIQHSLPYESHNILKGVKLGFLGINNIISTVGNLKNLGESRDYRVVKHQNGF